MNFNLFRNLISRVNTKVQSVGTLDSTQVGGDNRTVLDVIKLQIHEYPVSHYGLGRCRLISKSL